MQVSLKSDYNKRCFRRRPIYIYVISRSILHIMRISCKSCRENQNAYVMLSNFFFLHHAVHEIMWINIVESYRSQMTTWRMCIACWTTKAKHRLRICNTCCLFTATMVVRTCLNVTFISKLSVLHLLFLVFCNILGLLYIGRFIMYSGITKIYYRKKAGHVFTKPVQVEGTTPKIFPQ